tara:strand:- start:150 stop:893 length:744 start_codon:yes stop_codon:yes gene_type:complete
MTVSELIPQSVVLDMALLIYIGFDKHKIFKSKYSHLRNKCKFCKQLLLKPSSFLFDIFYGEYEDSLFFCFNGPVYEHNTYTNLSKFPLEDNSDDVYIHLGIFNQFKLIESHLSSIIENSSKKKVIFTGIFFGGSFATACALNFYFKFPSTIQCITYGSPLIGCNRFYDLFKSYIQYKHIYFDSDYIPLHINDDPHTLLFSNKDLFCLLSFSNFLKFYFIYYFKFFSTKSIHYHKSKLYVKTLKSIYS